MASTRGISKDTIYFKIPAFIADILVMVFIFEMSLRIIAPTMEAARVSDVDDLFAIPSLTLLLVAFGISLIAVKYNHHVRKITVSAVAIRTAVRTVITGFVFTLLVGIQFKVVPRRFILLNFTLTGAALCALHVMFTLYIRHLRQIGRNTVPVVIVGSDKSAVELYGELHFGMGIKGYRVQGFFTDEDQQSLALPEGARLLGTVSEVSSYIEDMKSDGNDSLSEVYCSLSPSEHTDAVNEIIRACEKHFVTFYYVQNRDRYTDKPMTRLDIGNVTVLRVEDEPSGTEIKDAGVDGTRL